jgi:predicted MFS family arabinose efflux permease
MSAFSLASIFGIPLGLYLASRFGWRTPFLGLAVLVALSLAVASKTVPSLREHLTDQVKRTGSLRALLFERNSLVACALVIFLMFAGFSVVPFIGAYLVANVGLQERDLASVFLVGGIATFFTTRLIGMAADRYGKLSVFTWLATLSMLPVLALTNLPHVSVISAIVVTTLVTVLISARAIPALAMITSSVDKCRRGRFLSLTSSVQQASSGIASLMAGAILGKTPGGALTHYDHAGAIAVIATGLAILTARNLRLPAPNNDDDRACEDV